MAVIMPFQARDNHACEPGESTPFPSRESLGQLLIRIHRELVHLYPYSLVPCLFDDRLCDVIRTLVEQPEYLAALCEADCLQTGCQAVTARGPCHGDCR
jgi:hypothetical protein